MLSNEGYVCSGQTGRESPPSICCPLVTPMATSKRKWGDGQVRPRDRTSPRLPRNILRSFFRGRGLGARCDGVGCGGLAREPSLAVLVRLTG